MKNILQPTDRERAALSIAPPPGTAALRTALAPTAGERARVRARAPRAARRASALRIRQQALVFAAAALAVVVVAWWPAPPALLAVDTQVVVAPADVVQLTPAAVATGVGTLRVLARDADGAQVELAEGRMVFDVDPQAPGHELVVRAGEVEVEVTGTRFAVGQLGDQVQVSVERGSVAVRWPSGQAALHAGEGWTGPPSLLAPLLPAPLPPPPAIPPAIAADPVQAPPPIVDPAEAARAWARILDLRDSGARAEDVLPAVEAYLGAHSDSALVAEAELLRLELVSTDGDPHAAVTMLEHWLRTHRDDPRRLEVHLWLAGVAAARLEDCARAEPSLSALAAAGPTWAEAAAPYARACGIH